MIYEYRCQDCKKSFDVVKPASQMEHEELCEVCKAPAVRQFVPSRVHFIGTSVQNPEYNPGLGCVVNNKKHREEIAKQKGLIEIGSEPAASLHKHYDKRREEKIEKAYDDAIAGWVGNGDTGA